MFFTGKGNLQLYGPTVQVTILPPNAVVEDLRKKGRPVPQQIVVALIDTGASTCSIGRDVAVNLGLVPFDKAKILTPSGESEHLLYDVGVILPITPTRVAPLQVFAANLDKQPYRMLIGRDILRFCTLFYHGPDNSFVLHG